MMVMIAQVMIEDAEWLMGIFVSQSMFHASAFDRRIVQPLDDFPFKVFRMVVKPNTVVCVVTQEMAFEILKTAPEHLDINIRKMVALYIEDFRAARDTGKCGV